MLYPVLAEASSWPPHWIPRDRLKRELAKGKEAKKDGFMASGGLSDMAYHGTGQLGERKTGDNPNAPSEEE